MSLNVPTYIRSVDTEKYQAIKEQGRGAWTEFIHKALNPEEGAYMGQKEFDEFASGANHLEKLSHKEHRLGPPTNDNRLNSQPIPKSFSARKKK